MSEILTFDEMNRLGMKRKSMEYAEYFGDMELTGDQVRERISFSEETDDELLLILTMLSLMNTYAVSEDEWIATTKQTLIADYTGIVEGYTPIFRRILFSQRLKILKICGLCQRTEPCMIQRMRQTRY